MTVVELALSLKGNLWYRDTQDGKKVRELIGYEICPMAGIHRCQLRYTIVESVLRESSSWVTIGKKDW